MLKQYVAEYRNNLLKKSAKYYLYVCFFVVISYIVIKAFIINLHLLSLEQYEHHNLNNLVVSQQSLLNAQTASTMIFFNIFRAKYGVKSTNNSSWKCQESKYMCSIYGQYYQQLSYSYSNYLNSTKLVTLINVSVKKQLVYRFGRNYTIPIAAIVNILNYAYNNLVSIGYTDTVISLASNQSYQLECAYINNKQYLCLIEILSAYLHQSNPIVSNKSILLIANASYLNYQQFIINYFNNRLLSSQYKFNIQSSYMTKCINGHLSNNIKQSIIKCYYSQYLHLIRYPILIGHFIIYKPTIHYSDLPAVKLTSQAIHYFILPNQIYFNHQNNIIKNGMRDIQLTIKIFIIVIVLHLCSLEYSTEYIKSRLVPCLDDTNKIIEEIVAKDSPDQWQIEINQIISKTNHTYFKSIIHNFQILLWYKRIDNHINNQEKKQLLTNGLKLFNIIQHRIILKYIYNNLISLEKQTLTKYRKIKLLLQYSKYNQNTNIDSIFYKESNLSHQNQNQQKNHQQKSTKYFNKLSPQYNHQFPLNNNLKRGVRFSNDNQLRQNDELFLKKSKFAIKKGQSLTIKYSNKSIQNQFENNKPNQLQNQKLEKNTIFNQKQIKQQNNHQVTNKDLINKDYSCDVCLNDQKKLGHEKQSQQIISGEEYTLLQFQKINMETILVQITLTYAKIIQYYQALIDMEKKYLVTGNNGIDNKKAINDLYEVQIERLKYVYKICKHSKTFNIECSDINYVNMTNFDELKKFQQAYDIDNLQLSKSLIYQMKIQKILNNPISYRQLDDLCKIQDTDIKLQARYLLANQFYSLTPHLDYEVFLQIYDNLSEQETTCKYKRKSLKLILNVIDKIPQFKQQTQTISMFIKYYNYQNKKFYFLIDFNQNIQFYVPVLRKIYQSMSKLDIVKIYNLNGFDLGNQQQQKNQNYIKQNSFEHFIKYIEELLSENSKYKSKISTKTLNKKIMYEKQFNSLLSKIQNDNNEFSKYLIILIGNQTNHNSSIVTDDAQTSSQHQRQIHQLIHGEVIKKMQKNYFHTIIIGQNLNNYQTKFGKIKKHVKISYSLLQIDLVKKSPQVYFKQIQKYLQI